MISKEEFCKIMNDIKATFDWIDKVESLFNCTLEEPLDSINATIHLLNTIFNLTETKEYGSDIEYFIYELEWGIKWKPDMIVEDGVSVDISTIEKLYDYIAK